MNRLALSLALGAALAVAAPALHAQRTIATGQTVSGRLAASDPMLSDSSYFHDYTFRGRPGEQIVVTLRSTAFDAVLAWGAGSGASFSAAAVDDDGAGGTDSQVRATVGSSGTHTVRVNSLAKRSTGAYTLTVQSAGGPSTPGPTPRPTTGGTTISLGQTVTGRLDTSDAMLSDSSYFDDYTYTGRAGDRIVVTMRSSEFDAYMAWGRGTGAAFRADTTDDDGGGGTDARIEVTVGSSGSYAVRANSLAKRTTGAYTLSVEAAGSPSTPTPARPRPSAGGTTISAGETVNGSLAASDGRLADGSHFDDYTYTGRPGEQIVITLRSRAFDTYLAWGAGSGGSFRSETTDDDGAGGTDSQVRVTVGSGGTYTVRANSLEAGKTGAYTLSVQSAGPVASGPSRPGAPGGTIRAGETVNGRLEASDPRLPDNSHYDTYVYEGRAGEQIVVTLTSTDFDAYLRGGRMQGGQVVVVDQDDDGAGGTNSRFQVTVPPSGTYAIQANSLRPATTGGYTLRVEGAGAAPTGVQTIALGQTVTGRLTAQDPKMADNSHYKLYVYRGTPGQQVVVTMRSTAFDAFMAWGRMNGGEFTTESSDDDSGGGTNAQIVATVGPSGTYAIRANTLRAGETGAFTLSVEPVSAVAQRAPATPAGAATLTAGQTVNGTLTRQSRMLEDSSFVDQYVYRGRPGDRLQITLRSTDFDVYLRWGRLNGAAFQEESHDDDGAGGTNAQLDVTVGGTGVYAIQANAFEKGATGSYTLSVRPVTATAAAATTAAAEARSGAAGKWLYAYTDVSNAAFRPVAQRLKQTALFETLTSDLNARFPLPRDVGLRAAECGRVNAFYSPRNNVVTLCYEMLAHLTSIFARSGRWTVQEREAVDGAATFIMMHEIGHALVHVMDLPITGREEDAVDQLATVMLIASGEKGAEAALNGVRAIQPGANAVFDNSDFADEHSLGPQRFFNVACWIYGSDPAKYRGLVANGVLPQARAARCPGEYQRLSKAWIRLLQEGQTARPATR